MSGAGRDVGAAIKSVRGQPNRTALIELMNRNINVHLKIGAGERKIISADQAEDALAALDMIGDQIRDEIRVAKG
jgi:ribosome-associated translation inhibitor RaiA